MKHVRQIVIVGGGPAGFFAAIRCAELLSRTGVGPTMFPIRILDAGKEFLRKVKISGGGRCNVTHNCFEPRLFCQNYPRGSRELQGPFASFQAKDTVDWFTARGVPLVAEADGRMFPETNTSQTIVDCLVHEAEQGGVALQLQTAVQAIEYNKKFMLTLADESTIECDVVLLATGSSRKGYELAGSLGHTITKLAPSLFSFKIQDELLEGLAGISFRSITVSAKINKKFRQTGPAVITHWGISGPAVLKISAWAARELQEVNYRCTLYVNWLDSMSETKALEALQKWKHQFARQKLSNPFSQYLTKRFWQRLLRACRVDQEKKWSEVSRKELQVLAKKLVRTSFAVSGKNRYKDEFVECGGVSCQEVDFKTMQSKFVPGLFFAGELLDIDGVTGGFNFQNAWTTGYIAGSSFLNILQDNSGKHISHARTQGNN